MKDASRKELMDAAPFIIRIIEAYESLDDEDRSIVAEMSLLVEKSRRKQEREAAAETLVNVLFPEV